MEFGFFSIYCFDNILAKKISEVSLCGTYGEKLDFCEIFFFFASTKTHCLGATELSTSEQAAALKQTLRNAYSFSLPSVVRKPSIFSSFLILKTFCSFLFSAKPLGRLTSALWRLLSSEGSVIKLGT